MFYQWFCFMKKIAIIGAGLSGLSAVQFLKDHAEVTLFEKALGVSGRISTRRIEHYFLTLINIYRMTINQMCLIENIYFGTHSFDDGHKNVS
jgi:uncharacterized protein with NAD-binding domain and iron-sulfur cluster